MAARTSTSGAAFDHAQEGLTSLLCRILLAIIILMPAVDTLFSQRDLMADDYFKAVAEAAATMADGSQHILLSWATGPLVLLALATIVICIVEGRKGTSGQDLGAALLLFYVTNLLLCVPFATAGSLSRSDLYLPLVFAAFYLSRDDGIAPLFDTGKGCLLLIMAGSIVASFLAPELTNRVDAADSRLPFLDFRLWGLGEHPNAIAPLALTLVFLVIVRPFKVSLLNVLAILSGAAVVVLAQSQTIWIVALTVTPWLIWYKQRCTSFAPPRRLTDRQVTIVTCVVLAALFVPLLALFYMMWSGVDLYNTTLLTGRPRPWYIAWQTFLQHPMLGYGPLAWEDDFRLANDLDWAVHSHNQLLQSLSVAGIAGGIGLLVYVRSLASKSLRLVKATEGLAPALFLIIFARSMTEVPITLNAALIGDTTTHLLLFRLLLTAFPETAKAPKPYPDGKTSPGT